MALPQLSLRAGFFFVLGAARTAPGLYLYSGFAALVRLHGRVHRHAAEDGIRARGCAGIHLRWDRTSLGGKRMKYSLLFVAGVVCAAPQPDWKSQGIVNNAGTPNAVIHSVPVRAVHMGQGFWAGRMRINMERSLPTMLDLLEEHGIVDNFRRLSGRKQAERH